MFAAAHKKLHSHTSAEAREIYRNHKQKGKLFLHIAGPEDIILKANAKKIFSDKQCCLFIWHSLLTVSLSLSLLLRRRNQWECFTSYFISSGLTHSHHSQLLHFIIYSERNLQLLLLCFQVLAKLTMFYLTDELSFAMLLRHLNEFKILFSSVSYGKLSEQTPNKLIHICVLR